MLTDFTTYALCPQYVLPLAEEPNQPTTRTARLFLTELPLALGIVAVSIAFFLLNNYLTDQDGLHIFSRDRHYPELVLVMAIFFMILFIELLFRSVLRLTLGRVSGLIWLGLFIVLSMVTEPGERTMGKEFFPWAIGAWLVASILLNRFLKRPAVFARIEQVWQAQFRWIFYGSALLYALFWVGSSKLTDWQLLFWPVLLASGGLIGLYLGYVRMRYGFWYAVLVQTLIMSVPVTLELMCIA